MKKLLAIAALVALSACATPDTPTGPTFHWSCDNNASFTVRLTLNGNAEVVAGGQTYRVHGVRAASGVRYKSGRVEYWEHGDEAMLNGAQGGPYQNCKRVVLGS
ncbi:MAG: MliC family protein [Alphaproteobacteria bacterium]